MRELKWIEKQDLDPYKTAMLQMLLAVEKSGLNYRELKKDIKFRKKEKTK